MCSNYLLAKKFVDMANLAFKCWKNFEVMPATAQKFMPFLEQKKAKNFDASFAQYTNFKKSKMHICIVYTLPNITRLFRIQTFFVF